MAFIDDCARFCYVYLLKKDGALHYFKVYKAKVENQIEKKIKRLRSDWGDISQMNFLSFVQSMLLFMGGHLHTHHNPIGLLKEKTRLQLSWSMPC
jgi:hypothetical protein